MEPTDDTCDVAIAGSGVAGLSAALAAAELGLRPIVFEKSEEVGGSTALANTLWVGANRLAAAAGHDDSLEDVRRYMRFVGGDQYREENLDQFVRVAPEALSFFERCGVRFRLVRNFVDHYYPRVPGSMGVGRSIEAELISEHEIGELAGKVPVKPDESTHVTKDEASEWGGHQNLRAWDTELLEERRRQRIRGRGAALIIHLLKQLRARSVPIRVGVGVSRLVHEGGRVRGVVTSTGERVAASRGVVLSTGGYESNPDLMRRFEDIPGPESMFVPGSTGDGLVMASEIGAAVTTIHNNLTVLLGFKMPAGSGTTFRLCGILELLSPHTAVVNYHGRRFADETYFQTVAARLRDFDVPTHRYANWPCFLVFDQQYVDKFSFAGGEPGTTPPEWVVRADSVTGLAEQLGIDARNLEETIARFNGFAESGVDEDFGRPTYEWSVSKRDSYYGTYTNPSLGSIAKPPFYGVPLHSAPFGSAGLSTDGHARVLTYREEPIPGLYAAGNAAAHTEYGVGYQAGYSLTSGMTFGYLAAVHMSGDRAAALAHPTRRS
ncbi:FAD-dependent oxidoreductase [Actinophytocola sp.]|uniref:FAD-dependent oxidoreductase n=1 Tax=Actinophytocola sp. TaxID=1872138 RepID=UPI003D6B6B2E